MVGVASLGKRILINHKGVITMEQLKVVKFLEHNKDFLFPNKEYTEEKIEQILFFHIKLPHRDLTAATAGSFLRDNYLFVDLLLEFCNMGDDSNKTVALGQLLKRRYSQ